MRLFFFALAAVATAAPQPQVLFSGLPLALRFEPNVGQTDQRVQFVARSSGYTVFLTPTGAVLAPRNSSEGVRIHFVNSTATKLEALAPLPGVSNYFRGSAQVAALHRDRARAPLPGQ